MFRGIRRFLCLTLVACTMVSTVGLTSDNSTSDNNAKGISNPQLAEGLMQVHIRRLHLVRPDLIPYPIAYEVVC